MFCISGGIEYIGEGGFGTSRGYHKYIGGYHEYIGDVQYIGVFNINERLLSACSPT